MPEQRAPEGRGDQEASKSARTRERILDAAAQVLNRKGYAGTRLSDVAELAQVQAPAVYYYFASRDQLLEEVVTLGLDRTVEHVTAALDTLPAGSTAMERICTAIAAHLEAGLRLSHYAAATIRHGSQLPAEMRDRLFLKQRSYAELWNKLFTEAVQAGEMDPDVDLRSARMLVLGAMNWSVEWWDPERGPLHDVIHAVQQLVRSGLSAPAE